MIVAGKPGPVFIETRPVDFSYGHQALALIVRAKLRLDHHSGVTAVFRSKRGTG
jgi:transposase